VKSSRLLYILNNKAPSQVGVYTLSSNAYVSVGIFYKDGSNNNILAATIESYVLKAAGVRFQYYNYNRDDKTTTPYDSGVIAVAEVGANWANIDYARIDMQVSTVGASSDHALTIDNLVEKYE
jgi:hypothetical protein